MKSPPEYAVAKPRSCPTPTTTCRLSTSTFHNYSDAGVISGTNNYNENLTYDLRGNIQTMQRTGFYTNGSTCTYGQIDNLTYSYTANTNRLHKVLDGAVTAGDAKSRGFNGNLSTLDNSMTYDRNGNLNKNLHKNVSTITYNHLNLPTVITFTTGNAIEFLYDAAGTKLRKTVKVGATVQYVQDYLPASLKSTPTIHVCCSIDFLFLTMKNQRLPSIDILRAITMLLMIFVNDLWSLTHVPRWLLHTAAEEDGMGLSDVVFPAFLFIVGLSIPHALKARLDKGASKVSVLLHILSRSFALLLMGLFMVNLENIDATQLLIRKEYWQILMALAFMLIWNNYRTPMVFGVVPAILLKISGWLILAFLASIYQGASGNWMMIHWWGILGLIGWGYLLVALLYLWIGDKVGWLGVACIGWLLLNVNEFVRLLGFDFQLVISASTHASVMLGVLTTVIYTHLAAKDQLKWLIPSLIGVALLLIVFGFATRPEWGISKIRATPSWTSICAGISILAFVLLHLIADVKGHTKWASFIAPAGSSTLTCYLMPYFAYAIVESLGWSLPDALTDGAIGLLKSALFALLVIQFTGWLNRVHIGLKI